MKGVLDYLSYVVFWGAVLYLFFSGLIGLFEAVAFMVDRFGFQLLYAIPPACWLTYMLWRQPL